MAAGGAKGGPAMIRSEKVEFPGAAGDLLAGRLDRPIVKPRAFGLFAHCFTCSKDVFAAQRISSGLAERGVAVLRFDFTGLGNSQGDFANTNFSSNVADLVAAADFLRRTHEAPKLLIGHSLGGAAVPLAALQIPECVGVATVNAPFDPAHVQHLLADALETIKTEGEAKVTLGGRSFTVRRDFLENLQNRSPLETLRKLRRALVIFHATQDQTVGIENARLIYEAAHHPKSFIALDGADHFLSRRSDAVYIAEMLTAWSARYLDAEAGPAPLADAPADAVVVTGAGDGRYAQAIAAHGHRLRADEPVEVGGDNSGPGPYELLQSALGACTAITVRMYAERKQWPLENVRVTLHHSKIAPAEAAGDPRLDRIERRVRLEGPLDSEQRQRLLEIANKCPVHRTLTSGVRVDTRPDDGG